MWDIEFTDEFGEWWDGLSEDEQESLTVGVKLLRGSWGRLLGDPMLTLSNNPDTET